LGLDARVVFARCHPVRKNSHGISWEAMEKFGAVIEYLVLANPGKQYLV
jgi:hypothetical protein